ncbi:MAG: amidohydrolase family protein [Phycisphaerales bacterium]|nr:amidohydrolase family protein [Phycisphaerales bacterium]
MTRPRIDAHQHFWRPARGDYGWLVPSMTALYRDFEPADLAPRLDACGIDGTVAVQAAPTVAETEFLLDLASSPSSFIRGVVGWIDLGAPDAVTTLDRLATNPRLRGIRPMIQDKPDDRWMLRPAHGPALRALADRGLVFDALVRPQHLSVLLTFVDRHPDLRVVVDHGAKPTIVAGGAEFAPWAQSMVDLARRPNVVCKLSGLVTEASHQWTVRDLRPFADVLFETFGTERVIWGSDWPVLTTVATYEQWWDATEALVATLSADERDAVMGGNAVTIYGLAPHARSLGSDQA